MSSKDAGGIYFVDGGELYKGTSRFGANKVTAQATPPTAAQGAIAGDVNIYNSTAKIFDGANWQTLNAKISFTSASWGGNGKYITTVAQNADGEVTATAVAFPTLATGDSDGQVKLGSTNASVSGWTTLTGSVDDLESRVSDIEGIVDAENSTVTATTGNFTNLTVSNTATFSATTVSATSLTVSGSTVEQIADSRIAAISSSTVTSTATGITVGVTTSGGSVTAVSVNAESFTNAMHFLGVGTVAKNTSGTGDSATVTPPAGKTPVAGDIVIDSSTGLEAICTSATTGETPVYHWELIGDNSVYALNAYSSTASVYTAANAETVPTALNAVGAAVDALNASMPTRASVGTGTATASYGVSGEVVLAANAQPSFSITVTPVTTSAGITDQATDSLATAAAIKAYVDGAIAAINIPDDTKGDSDKGVQVSVTTTDGVVTAVDVVTTLDTDIGPSSGTGAATDDEIPSSLAVRKAIEDAALVWKNASGQVID